MKSDLRTETQGVMTVEREGKRFLTISPHVRSADPVYVRTSSSSEILPIHVQVGEGAEITLFDELSDSGTYAIDVAVGARARVTYVTLARAKDDAEITVRQNGRVDAEGSILWINASIGGERVTHALESDLIGDGARSDVRWLSYARGSQRHELSARNSFSSRNGGGEIVMRCVAEEQAHAALRGMIEIGQLGSGTDTYLTQEVLMLDTTAKVDAVPKLEIKANDVKASHSATISRVTEEDLFYFAARGIEEGEARKMFVAGFLGDIAGYIADPALQKVVTETIGAGDLLHSSERD